MARQLLGVEPARGGKPGAIWQPPDPIRQPVTDALRQQRPFLTERFDQAVSFRHGGEDHQEGRNREFPIRAGRVGDQGRQTDFGGCSVAEPTGAT